MKYIRATAKDLEEKINQLGLMFERLRLKEYLAYLNNPRRMFFRSFLNGIAKGLGAAVGFTLLGALLIYILQQNFMQNLPLIGDIIGEIMKIANDTMKK